MMPVSAVWAGDQEAAHLKAVSGVGDAHVTCSTSGDTPFRLNLAVQDVGHTLIIGPTGAGKSTLLALLAMQWLRYPGAKVVIFDKDRSARAATMAVGGTYYEPGDETSPVAFQPLADIDKRAERIWATQFVLNLLAAQRHPETTRTKRRASPKPSPAWPPRPLPPHPERPRRHARPRAGRRCSRPYTIDPEAGRFGQIFDADHDELRDASWLHFEMGPLMSLGEEAIVPALDYLFHRVEQGFDGSPTLMILDEAWLFLRHPIFMRRLQDWLKTLRKKNVYVVFATQEVADAADSPILPTILSACPTKIYLPNEEALTPHISASVRRLRPHRDRDRHPRRRPRRSATTTTDPSAAAGCSRSISARRRSPSSAMSSPADQRFLDGLVASAVRRADTRS